MREQTTTPTPKPLGQAHPDVLMKQSGCALDRIAELIADHVMGVYAVESAISEAKDAEVTVGTAVR